MRYRVSAYLRTNFLGLMDSLETDDFYEVQDFIFANCQNGFDCELIDNERGTRGWAYHEDFAEETDEFYEDLRMEQCEQM